MKGDNRTGRGFSAFHASYWGTDWAGRFFQPSQKKIQRNVIVVSWRSRRAMAIFYQISSGWALAASRPLLERLVGRAEDANNIRRANTTAKDHEIDACGSTNSGGLRRKANGGKKPGLIHSLTKKLRQSRLAGSAPVLQQVLRSHVNRLQCCIVRQVENAPQFHRGEIADDRLILADKTV
jgi:hypothetical protein